MRHCLDHRFPVGFGPIALVLSLAGCVLFASDRDLAAAAPRVSAAGQTPRDARLDQLKDLDGYFPWTPPNSPAQWDRRKERLQRQILVALGLWPMPTPVASRPIIHGSVDRETYTVERVAFESYPGQFVTGSLYRPKGVTGRKPGVLSPHGHWANGRFFAASDEETKRQLDSGAEKFAAAARHPLQARCVQLARMGCVVFHYDTVGDADSLQIPASITHGFAKQRPELDQPDSWGFFGVQAELRQQSIMGLYTYNSIRALDFLLSLDDVDPQRIGVTGASGGGTQTMMLCAVDPRPTVAFPAVMVSTSMQGGCTCENASLLRVDTGNIEFAALMAPRPLGMAAADDWTRELMTKGLPELKRHYAMLKAPDNVMAVALLHFPHNFNGVSGQAMYQWFNRHFNLGHAEPIMEQDFTPLSIAEMTVWDEAHPRPLAGADHERQLTRAIDADSSSQLAAITPRDGATLAKFRHVFGGAFDVLVGRGLPDPSTIDYELVSEVDRGDYQEFTAWLKLVAKGEALPTVFLLPKNWNGEAVVWLDGAGKDALFGADGRPCAAAAKLLARGSAIATADLIYQGEFLADGKPLAESRRVNTPREFAGYTWGYNPTLFAQRTHDILTLISFCKHYAPHPPRRLTLVATGGAGPWAAAALAQVALAQSTNPQSNAIVDRAAIDTSGFRFAKISSLRDPDFLPGSLKYGDLPAMLALAAPTPLWLAGENGVVPAIAKASYTAAGKADHIVASAEAASALERNVSSGPTVSSDAAARMNQVADWLLKDGR